MLPDADKLPAGRRAGIFRRENAANCSVASLRAVFYTPSSLPGTGLADLRQQYLAERYAALNRLAEKKPIRHRFGYLLKMVRRDAALD